MSEQDESKKAALRRDNPDPDVGDEGDKGLGSETGAEGAAADPGDDVTESMPDARGEVRYPGRGGPGRGAVRRGARGGWTSTRTRTRKTDAAPGAKD